jgi:TatD DNase family protein
VYFDFHTHHYAPLVTHRVYNLPAYASPDTPGASIGIHPYWLDEHDLSTLTHWVERTLQEQKIAAIGECGIDKRMQTSLTVQIDTLKLHIQWAQTFQKPLIIHCVRGHQEVLGAFKQAKYNGPVIFHGFRGSEQLALQLIDKGYYLGIGDMEGKPSLQQLASRLPLANVVLETDDGSKHIESIYQSFCEIRGISMDALKKAMMESAMVIFGSQINNPYGFQLA